MLIALIAWSGALLMVRRSHASSWDVMIGRPLMGKMISAKVSLPILTHRPALRGTPMWKLGNTPSEKLRAKTVLLVNPVKMQLKLARVGTQMSKLGHTPTLFACFEKRLKQQLSKLARSTALWASQETRRCRSSRTAQGFWGASCVPFWYKFV